MGVEEEEDPGREAAAREEEEAEEGAAAEPLARLGRATLQILRELQPRGSRAPAALPQTSAAATFQAI